MKIFGGGFGMRWIIALVFGLALSGCMTPEQQQEMNISTCEGYGFKPGTNDFARCMQNENLAAQERAAAAADAFAQGFNAGWTPPRQTTSTTTQCRQWGNNVRCRTY